MLLDNFLEAGIIELGELCYIMHVGNDVAQVFLKQHEILLGRTVLFGFPSDSTRRRLLRPIVIQAGQHIANLLFASLDPAHNLARFDALKGEDFIELGFEHGDEGFLVFLGPWSSAWMGLLRAGLLLVGSLEGILQIVVGDIVVIVIFQERCFQLLAEAGTEQGNQRWPPIEGWKWVLEKEDLLHDSPSDSKVLEGGVIDWP